MKKAKQRHPYHMFTRDFSLFTSELWYWLVTESMRADIGFSLSDQIVNYDGRSAQCFRLKEDMDDFKKLVINLPDYHRLFSEESHLEFRSILKEIKRLIAIKPREPFTFNPIQKVIQHWEKIWAMFVIAFNLPSGWAEDIKKKKGARAKRIINDYYQDRVSSEGAFELMDATIREYIEQLFKKHHIPTRYSHLIGFTEFMDLMELGIKPPLSVLQARSKGYVTIKGKIYTGKDFAELLKKHGYIYSRKDVNKNIKAFEGLAAYSSGIVRGRVSLVFNIQDMKKFIKGKIMVSPETSPVFLPAMKKAKAIITDEGGITSHASIASREFKIPCIVGTKIATKALKNDQQIEIDTKNGIIKII